MTRICLCEGKTDAIILSYFLISQYQWTFDKMTTRNPKVALPIDHENESLKWYVRDTEMMAIWGCGGKSALPVKLEVVIERNSSEPVSTRRFDKIAVVFDRDRDSDDECVAWISSALSRAMIHNVGDIEMNKWMEGVSELKTTPVSTHSVSVLALAIPPSNPGCLERFLLDGLAAGSTDDSELVRRSEHFISELPQDPYFPQDRLRVKASLGVVLSILSPDWVFSDMDARLQRIQWESLETIDRHFGLLDRL